MNEKNYLDISEIFLTYHLIIKDNFNCLVCFWKKSFHETLKICKIAQTFLKYRIIMNYYFCNC